MPPHLSGGVTDPNASRLIYNAFSESIDYISGIVADLCSNAEAKHTQFLSTDCVAAQSAQSLEPRALTDYTFKTYVAAVLAMIHQMLAVADVLTSLYESMWHVHMMKRLEVDVGQLEAALRSLRSWNTVGDQDAFSAVIKDSQHALRRIQRAVTNTSIPLSSSDWI